MAKTITIEIPQGEARKFSEEVARLAAQIERSEVESLEREARIWRDSAETDRMLESIRRSLANVERYQSASFSNPHGRTFQAEYDYWREEAQRLAQENEILRQEIRRLSELNERSALSPALHTRKPKKS